MDNRVALKNKAVLELIDAKNHKKKYLIDEEIGRGGSCIVYNASYSDSLGLEHLVRIKECNPLNVSELESDGLSDSIKANTVFQNKKEKFMQAYKNTAAIQKEIGLINSTAAVSDLYQANNTYYIVSEYNEGSSYDLVSDDNLIDLFTTIKSIAIVIHKYHQMNLLYLDIKPCNILILPETREHVVLFDFDSFYAISDYPKMEENYISYSKGFAAPEQVRGDIKKIGKWTDIYGIGALLYFKLFGVCPEYNQQMIGAKYDFSKIVVDDVKKYPISVMNTVNTILHKTLAASVSARWKDMEQVIEHIDSVLASLQKVALDNFILGYTKQMIDFDLFSYKKKLFSADCKSIEEYAKTMNQTVRQDILNVFALDGEMVTAFLQKYEERFSALGKEIIIFLNISDVDLEQAILKNILEKKEAFFRRISEYMNFEEVHLLNIDVQNENPDKGQLLNLRRERKLWDILHGGQPMDIYYKIPKKSELEILERLHKICTAVENQVHSVYVQIIYSLSDTIISRAIQTKKSTLKNLSLANSRLANSDIENSDIENSGIKDSRIEDSCIEDSVSENWDLANAIEESYNQAVALFYANNDMQEGLSLLFETYEKYNYAPALEAIEEKMPIYNAQLIDAVCKKRLFYRIHNDFSEGGYLRFYYADCKGKEYYLDNYMAKCYVNYVTYASLRIDTQIYIVLDDTYTIELYVFSGVDNSFTLLETQKSAPIYGELFIEAGIIYGQVDLFTKDRIAYNYNQPYKNS